MKKIAVIFWSGTGNTEKMADAVVEGAKAAGADVSVFSAAAFDPSMIVSFNAFAWGCPAMGAEVLEEDVFEPLFRSCKDSLAGKKVLLFGSYGWGDGEWMRNWEEECRGSGITLVDNGIICNDAPGDAEEEECRAGGRLLAE